MVPFLWRAAWKVKDPSSSRSFRCTLSHCTTNRLPERSSHWLDPYELVSPHKMTLFYRKMHRGWDIQITGCSQTCSHVLTVVQILHCGVIGEAWIKVCHQRGDVLRGGQHPMGDLPHEDEPCVTQVHVSKYSKIFSNPSTASQFDRCEGIKLSKSKYRK